MKKLFIALIVFVAFSCINVNAFTGWKTINGNKYYYENNVKVKGLKTIKDKHYYFSSTGILQKNRLINYGHEFYYAQKDGSFIYGWFNIGNKRYYFSSNDGKAYKGYHEIGGKMYYFYGGNATLRTGKHKTANNLYYSDKYGVVQTGWKTIDGKKYYFSKSAPYEAYKGYNTISGTVYYFYQGTYALRKGFHKTKTNLYYSDGNGVVQTGWKTIDGKRYYFNKTAPYQAAKGYKEIDGTMYYFYQGTYELRKGFHKTKTNLYYSNGNGVVQTGWQTISGNTYYFNESYPYQAANGYKEIDGNLYYFYGGTWALRKGFHKTASNLYYSNEDGIVQTGWQTISGKTYYFSEASPYQAYSGVKRVDGDLYYFDPTTRVRTTGWAGSGTTYYHSGDTGILDTVLVTIGNTKYKFNDNGKLLGFSKNNNKIYYTNPDGKILKGTIRMCNKYFKFDELDGHFVKFVNKKSVIDVSVHNGNIDWKKIKYSGEVDAVIVRIGYASENEDANFKKNIDGLKKYKIPYSVYLFSYAENESEALLEAKFVVKTLKKYNCKLTGNIPIYYDLEPWSYKENGKTISSSSISKATYGKMINKFVTYVEKNYGKKTRVYASRDYITSHFPENYQKYATWVAAWVSNLNYSGPYEGWQYTSEGKVGGISGRVDMSWFYY